MARKKKCLSMIFPWNDKLDQEVIKQAEYGKKESVKHIVYHLFGSYLHNHFRAVSEDDYFDFLGSLNKVGKDHFLPQDISSAMIDSTILLLGFKLNDWSFRMTYQFLRVLMNESAYSRERKMPYQVSVQLDPDDDMVMDPDKAKQYLQKFFDLQNIKIFWGNEGDFLRNLWNEYSKGTQ